MFRRVLVCIALGMVTTILVAWGCALWVYPNQGNPFNSIGWSDGPWSIWMARSAGAITIQRAPSFFGGPMDAKYRSDLPHWSAVHEPAADGERLFLGSWVEDARGWPFVCLQSERKYGSSYLPEDFGDVHMMRDLQTIGGPATHLPLRPIWREFVLTAAIYAAAWAVLLNVPRFVHRARRRRAGCCTRCGYDLRYNPGPVCSECGALQPV